MSLIRVTEEGVEVDGILLKDITDIKAYISAHQPESVEVSIGAVQPEQLIVQLRGVWPFGEEALEFTTDINMHFPRDLTVMYGISQPTDLSAIIRPMHITLFKAWFFTVEFGQSDLHVNLTTIREGILNLSAQLHIWSIDLLRIYIRINESPLPLYTYVWVWTPSVINVLIGITRPPPLIVDFQAVPAPGIDLIVYHGFYKYTNLNVDFDIWTGLWNLRTFIHGVYKSDLQVDFRMGGYLKLEVPLPGTSGYKNLFITLRPSSRIMTTIIPVYTIEIKDLYVSINQGWPCGFGSAYKLLYVDFNTSYFHAFTATFKVITGSGVHILGVFVNRSYFDTYINSFNFKIKIPKENILPETRIMDELSIIYDNEFADLYQDVMQVTFNWPRIRLLNGLSTFYVELIPYKGDKVYELNVILVALRQMPMVQLTSRPLMPRETALEDPIWPDVFQVTEIELWGDDPPEVVRRIEIKFEEQIHEYYWVSQEQKAYSKNAWEQWAFLTRGYLPHAEYSGQIDYVTMRSLSSMERYDTIDQAVKAMIQGFLYQGRTDFNVILNPTGKITRLLVELTIRDWSRLKNLRITIEPMHTHLLSVDLKAI
jgi:hypothetical protein